MVKPAPAAEPGPALEVELISFCRARLGHMKCPRTVDFLDEFQRLPTGKRYKTAFREKYWKGHASRILQGGGTNRTERSKQQS